MNAPGVPNAPAPLALAPGELLAWSAVVLLVPVLSLAARYERAARDAEVVSVRLESPSAPASKGVPSPARLNLNHASAAELELLPGIGAAKARKIVEYRESHGPFLAVDELSAIRGISKAMTQRLEPLVTTRSNE
ncbi:MAG: helix-hairpin-helix domain-containing protein [Planctomycetes bacterium]|nr:helix-hairpin-helix domain-containing protein [Planctomycetota bacterium]